MLKYYLKLAVFCTNDASWLLNYHLVHQGTERSRLEEIIPAECSVVAACTKIFPLHADHRHSFLRTAPTKPYDRALLTYQDDSDSLNNRSSKPYSTTR